MEWNSERPSTLMSGLCMHVHMNNYTHTHTYISHKTKKKNQIKIFWIIDNVHNIEMKKSQYEWQQMTKWGFTVENTQTAKLKNSVVTLKFRI